MVRTIRFLTIFAILAGITASPAVARQSAPPTPAPAEATAKPHHLPNCRRSWRA